MDQRREQEMRNRRELEHRRAKSRTAKKRKKKGGKGLFAVMLCLLLAGALVLCGYTFLFPVKTIQIEGNSRYTREEILKASGIETGNNLLSLRPEIIKNNIRLSCPYVLDVVLQRKLPNKAVLTVTEGLPSLAFLVNGEYYLVNNRLELMEVTAEPMGGSVIHGAKVTSNGVGKPVTVETAQVKTLLETVVNELEKQGINQITQMDLRDANNIRLLFDNRHVWEVGTTEKLAYKFEFGAEISKREAGSGVVNLVGLTTGKNGYYQPAVIGDFVAISTESPTNVSVEE